MTDRDTITLTWAQKEAQVAQTALVMQHYARRYEAVLDNPALLEPDGAGVRAERLLQRAEALYFRAVRHLCGVGY